MPKNVEEMTDVEKYIQLFEQMQLSLQQAKTPEEKNELLQMFELRTQNFSDKDQAKARRMLDAGRDEMSMGSLMVPPEREAYVGGGAALLKAILKPKTKKAKKISDKLQETYNTEEIEEAVQEMVEIVDKNTKVNKAGKADLKIKKSDLVMEASNNLSKRDVFMTTNDLENILKLDNIREGSGGKTDNLYDSIVQLAASKIEEPSLMGQFVGDIAGLSTRGDRSTAVDTGLKTAAVAGTAGALLSNVDRLSDAAEGIYSELNPSERERFNKEFSAAQKKGLKTFDFIGDDGETRTIAVKLAAEDNPNVVYERAEKAFGGVLKAISKRLGKKQGAEDIAEISTKELMELDESVQIETMGKLLGYSNKEILKLVKDSKTDPKIYEILTDELIEMNELMKERLGKADGGPMPVDTYDNISPEEEMQQAEDMLPDEEMEEEYVDYVAEEVLEPEEQEYLFKVLDEDPRLEGILDKIILNATEFAGEGEVEGPGTGISDSIPARLSDGEFVITRKATDQIGADNLQKMMDDAERAYDGGLMAKAEGGMPVEGMERYDMEKDDEDTLNRQMAYSNRMPSLMNQ